MKIYLALPALFLATGAQALPVLYTVADSTIVLGADSTHTGSTVSLTGKSETIEVPSDAFSIQELTVGTLSLTTSDPLSRNLPSGFSIHPYTIGVTIAGVERDIVLEMHFNADHTNDSFFIQGGTGTTAFQISSALIVEFQFLTASVPGANAGETKTEFLKAQFYGRQVPVPEPNTLYLAGLGWLTFGRFARPNRQDKDVDNLHGATLPANGADASVLRTPAPLIGALGVSQTLKPVPRSEEESIRPSARQDCCAVVI